MIPFVGNDKGPLFQNKTYDMTAPLLRGRKLCLCGAIDQKPVFRAAAEQSRI